MRKLTVLLIMVLCSHPGARGQGMPSVDSLVHLLEGMQVARDDFYFAGTFPVYRRYGRSPRLKEDNDVFYTGLVAFTLQGIRSQLSRDSRARADTMIRRAVASYTHFRNLSGNPTFNFWQSNPPLIFPNSWFLNQFNEVNQLPDDLDDTAILWLTLHASDSVAGRVKALMEAHANGGRSWIGNTYPYYRKLRAYSTWFGVKMPIDFDFCVLCNVLYFVKMYDLPFTVQDSASVEYLRQVIVRRQYMDHASYVSPHYGRPPVLLYHITRLLTQLSVPALDTLRPQLLADARAAYAGAGNWLDSVLLSTAILRLGGSSPPLPAFSSEALQEHMPTFFVASFASYLPQFFKKMLLHSQVIKYYFSCPAYRCALYLENRVLREAAAKPIHLAVAGSGTF